MQHFEISTEEATATGNPMYSKSPPIPTSKPTPSPSPQCVLTNTYAARRVGSVHHDELRDNVLADTRRETDASLPTRSFLYFCWSGSSKYWLPVSFVGLVLAIAILLEIRFRSNLLISRIISSFFSFAVVGSCYLPWKIAFPAVHRSFTTKQNCVTAAAFISYAVISYAARTRFAEVADVLGDELDIRESPLYRVSIWSLFCSQLYFALLYRKGWWDFWFGHTWFDACFRFGVCLGPVAICVSHTPSTGFTPFDAGVSGMGALLFFIHVLICYSYIFFLHGRKEKRDGLISRNGFYMILQMELFVGFPQFMSENLGKLFRIFGNEVVIIIVWQLFFLLFYCGTRLSVRRATTPWLAPPLMLPLMLCGDFMLNFIFLEADWRLPIFWAMLFVEVVVQVARDTHMYDVFANMVVYRLGNCTDYYGGKTCATCCLGAMDTVVSAATGEFHSAQGESRNKRHAQLVHS